MDARRAQLAIILAALLSLGASYRTQNFIVSASSPQLAQEVALAAEEFRRDLAIQWLGEELPAWRDPCPINVTAGPRMPAGGETSFMFAQDRPFGWQMAIQGSRDRVLDSVLPHEITHTIFATHFGRPLPRWADEGACTTVEHHSERRKHDAFLIQFLTTGRGIAFNEMFAMTEYPSDILPLYSQGYSLARFLIEHGGQRKFVQYVGDGLQHNNWTAATRKHYGYESLSNLQVTWLDWVRHGSPKLPADFGREPQPASEIALASHTSDTSPVKEELSSDLVPIESAETLADAVPLALAQKELPSRASGPERRSTGGWYARQRDQAYAARIAREQSQPSKTAGGNPVSGGNPVASARTPGLERAEQTILQQSAAAPIGNHAEERGTTIYR